MKKIVILGASGRTGTLLTQFALENGYQVTALVRSPEKMPFKNPHLTVIKGNVLNVEDIIKACMGKDAVLSTLGRDGKKIDVLTTGTQNILKAMEQTKVARFICMSSMGSGSSSKSYGLLFQFIVWLMGLKASFRAKGVQEEMLHASNVNFCLVHAGSLTDKDNINLTEINTVSSKDLKPNFWGGPGKISRAQVAKLMLVELESPKWTNATVCVYSSKK